MSITLQRVCKLIGFMLLALVIMRGASEVGAKQEQSPETWAAARYESALAQLFPCQHETLNLSGDTKWETEVQIHDAFRQSEYWLSLIRRYNGRVELTIRTPKGASFLTQLQRLRREKAQEPAPEIFAQVQLDEYKMTEKDLSELPALSIAFENIRMPVVMPDTLIADPVSYTFCSKSQHGQSIEVELIGPGPDSPKQPHPLLDWAERIRKIARDRRSNKQ